MFVISFIDDNNNFFLVVCKQHNFSISILLTIIKNEYIIEAPYIIIFSLIILSTDVLPNTLYGTIFNYESAKSLFGFLIQQMKIH